MNYKRKFLIVGAGWAGVTFAKSLVNEAPRSFNYEIVGFLDDKKPQIESIEIEKGEGKLTIPVLSTSDKIVETALKYGAKEIIIAITHERGDHVLAQVVACYANSLIVHQMPDIYSDIFKKIPINHIDHHWVLPTLKPPRKGFNEVIISTIDYVTCLVLLLLVYFPLFPFIALAIKITSPGPLYFFQKRVGMHGKRFTIIKFRTMKHKARSEGASWTTENDTRITFTGKFMRKFRIDELPQLINVLKGEMALIGPRPEAVDLVAQFRRNIPFYNYRYLVKPGITGWAQVVYRNTSSVEEALIKLQYDLYWIKKRSISLCVKIILKTIRVSLTGFGSV
jgi:exopolysaccharide biosynthesis polyprenyl glycosylphosphotransferase